MDAYERKAAFAEARAEAYEVSLARHSVSSKSESSNNSNSDTQHRKLTDAEGSRWQRYIDGQINTAISAAMAEHKMLADARQEAVGKALGEVRKQLREEIAAEVGQLRADLTVEKAHGGEIIDLPALPLRDRRG
jgi:hypothetical protein